MSSLRTDDPDDFGLVLFKTLGYTETLYVTDDTWLSPTGPFARNPLEPHLMFRPRMNRDVPAGTVLRRANFTLTNGAPGNFQLSDAGDQLLAYLWPNHFSNTTQPTFLCGIDNTATGCLVTDYSALSFGHDDNLRYVGGFQNVTNAGTVAALRASIVRRANWVFNNTDDPDDFGLVLFKTLGYTETLYVTDDTWLSPTGPFARNPLEPHLMFRPRINGNGLDVPAGTVLRRANFTLANGAPGNFQASDVGDQLLAYLWPNHFSNTTQPTFLCGIDNTATGWFVPSSTCTETCNYASDGDCDDGGPGSDSPFLVPDYSALSFGHDDNLRYVGGFQNVTNAGTVA
ncbi:hypothetical protein Ctob_004997, partial [Chrysochromulina tobinii]